MFVCSLELTTLRSQPPRVLTKLRMGAVALSASSGWKRDILNLNMGKEVPLKSLDPSEPKVIIFFKNIFLLVLVALIFRLQGRILVHIVQFFIVMCIRL